MMSVSIDATSHSTKHSRMQAHFFLTACRSTSVSEWWLAAASGMGKGVLLIVYEAAMRVVAAVHCLNSSWRRPIAAIQIEIH